MSHSHTSTQCHRSQRDRSHLNNVDVVIIERLLVHFIGQLRDADDNPFTVMYWHAQHTSNLGPG